MKRSFCSHTSDSTNSKSHFLLSLPRLIKNRIYTQRKTESSGCILFSTPTSSSCVFEYLLTFTSPKKPTVSDIWGPDISVWLLRGLHTAPLSQVNANMWLTFSGQVQKHRVTVGPAKPRRLGASPAGRGRCHTRRRWGSRRLQTAVWIKTGPLRCQRSHWLCHRWLL